MKAKGMRNLLTILIVFTCFGTIFSQAKTKKTAFVGNIKLEIRAKNYQSAKYYYDAPVNSQRLIFRWSDSIRSEFSETKEFTQLNWSAAEDKNNVRQAFLNLVLMVSNNYGKTKTVRKKVKILKGETKSFQIKNNFFITKLLLFTNLKTNKI